MPAKNKVIAGDYEGSTVVSILESVQISVGLFKKNLILDNSTIENYELITNNHRKSASSVADRRIIGGALIGPIGIVDGDLTAKNKGIFIVAIKFKDGKESLLEINDKIYNNLAKNCF